MSCVVSTATCFPRVDEIDAVDRDGNLALVAAAEEAGVERFVFLSFRPVALDFPLQRAKRAMPYGYLIKPFEERELATTIDMALYRHRAERRIREQSALLDSALTGSSTARRAPAALARSIARLTAVVWPAITTWSGELRLAALTISSSLASGRP